MHVAIDIDGTLNLPPEEFEFPMCEEWLKDHGFPIRKRDYSKLRAYDAFGIEQGIYKKWLNYYFGINCKKNPPQIGAPEALRLMKMRGYKISIVTRRDPGYHGLYNGQEMVDDTTMWFIKYNIPYDHIYYGCVDKAKILKEIGADIMIEDEVSNLLPIVDQGIPCIAVAQKYNEDFKGYSPLLIRIEGWPAILSFLEKYEKTLL